ncbi:cupin domain-containing protein [Halobaculum sp. MBLA0147]|uniref:cupin domain-containing protein n=1 Tax=Halobaculum sp. MBLA0147 TaxID=3079934 RepID=UPI00352624E4
MDELAPAVDDLDPGPGEVETAELVVTDDVLVKLFALGPDARIDPHEHGDSTNVFHLLDGDLLVTSGEETARLSAPAVVEHPRGVAHGAENPTDERALVTASLCPLPGGGE